MAVPGTSEDNVVPLMGRPRDIQFPRSCPHCTRPATSRLTVGRVTAHRDEESGELSHTVIVFHPYFCDACIAIHRTEQKPDPTLPFRRILHGWKLWIPLLGSAWVCSIVIEPFLSALAKADRAGILINGGILTLFATVSFGCAIAIWAASRHLAITPPSSVTSAITFSDDLSRTFEPQWRRFTLRNAAYAELFRGLNRSRLWSRQRKEAQRALVLRYYGKILGFTALGILLVFALADEFGFPLWEKLAAIFQLGP